MFLRHSLIYLLAKGLPSLVAFFSIAIYTRLIDPREFGVYTLVYTGAVLLASIFFQWLRLGLLRFYHGRSDEQKSTLLSTITLAFMAVAIFLIFMIIPVIYVFGRSELIALGLLIGIAQGAFDILLERSRVEMSPLRFGVIAFMRAVLMLTGGVVGFELGGVPGLLFGILFGMLLVTAVELLRALPSIHVTLTSKTELLQLVRYGAPLSATFVLAGVMGFADRYMLAWMQGTSSAGYYAAAYDLSQKIIITLMSVVNLAGYPLLLKAQSEGDNSLFQKFLKQTLSGLLFIGLPILLLFVMLPASIAGTFLGSAFHHEAIILLPWLAAAALLEGMKIYYFDLSFQLQEHTIHQVWIVAVAAALNVSLNFWLIPSYGGLGAAWATLTANALAIGLSFALSRTQLVLPLLTRESIAIVVSGLMMGASLWWLASWTNRLLSTPLLQLLVLSVLAGFVYLLCILLFDVFGMRSAIQAKAVRRIHFTRNTHL